MEPIVPATSTFITVVVGRANAGNLQDHEIYGVAKEVDMATEPKTGVYGTLGENGDTWFVMTVNRMVMVDTPFLFDISLEHQTVRIIGRMDIPESAVGITKLIAERIISHAAIARRAYEIYRSGDGGSDGENWFGAERGLLGF
jgi:hypothetical protein